MLSFFTYAKAESTGPFSTSLIDCSLRREFAGFKEGARFERVVIDLAAGAITFCGKKRTTRVELNIQLDQITRSAKGPEALLQMECDAIRANLSSYPWCVSVCAEKPNTIAIYVRDKKASEEVFGNITAYGGYTLSVRATGKFHPEKGWQ